MVVVVSDLDRVGALEQDWEEASVKAAVLALEVVPFPSVSVTVVEGEAVVSDRALQLAAVVLDRVVQVPAALETAWADVLEEAKAEVVAPAAAMA